MLAFFKNYFADLRDGLKALFLRIGWQGVVLALFFAFFMAVILPSCVVHLR
jgi:hypothetical protein